VIGGAPGDFNSKLKTQNSELETDPGGRVENSKFEILNPQSASHDPR